MDKYQVLNKYFNYKSFRNNQEFVIDSILDKRNTLCILSTGGGKSLIYQICGLVFEGITIVVSPLISLMEDQTKKLNDINVTAKCLVSSLNYFEKEEIYNKVINNKLKFLYVSPEKLGDLKFINLIKNVCVSQLVIDEAHCISLYGHDFRPSFRKISGFIKALNNKPVISLFTATASDYVINDLKRMFENLNIIKSNLDRKNLYYKNIKTNNKFNILIKYLNKNDPIIIYCLTVRKCDQLFDSLKELNYKVTRYHSELEYFERKNNSNLFMSRSVNIMIATNAYGMGIDKSDIRCVINYGIPMSLEDLIQQQGRCSRDNKDGKCILIYNRNDICINKYFISNFKYCLNNKEMKIVKKIKKEKLNYVLDYLNTKICLRRYLLAYFNQNSKSICNKCSNCENIKKRNYIKIAKIIIITISITKQIYTFETIIEILLGIKSDVVKENKFYNLDTFNSSLYNKDTLIKIIDNLIFDFFIEKKEKCLKLTNNSLEIYKKDKYLLAI